MDAGEFFDRVEAHPDLEGLGVDGDDDGAEPAAVVRHVPTGAKFRLEFSAIGRYGWETLEEILTGRREPKVLSHMTRVVGYFSRVENWNRSKVGELQGRQRGDYNLKA